MIIGKSTFYTFIEDSVSKYVSNACVFVITLFLIIVLPKLLDYSATKGGRGFFCCVFFFCFFSLMIELLLAHIFIRELILKELKHVIF